jgi:hypothetical protein
MRFDLTIARRARPAPPPRLWRRVGPYASHAALAALAALAVEGGRAPGQVVLLVAAPLLAAAAFAWGHRVAERRWLTTVALAAAYRELPA